MISRMSNSELSMAGGVIAGLSYRVGVPTFILRLLFILSLFFFSFVSLAVYLFLWVFMPPKYISKENFNIRVRAFKEDSTEDVTQRKD